MRNGSLHGGTPPICTNKVEASPLSFYYGPLAHLVERVIRIDEVTGSNPVRSTPLRNKVPIGTCADPIGNGFLTGPTLRLRIYQQSRIKIDYRGLA